jgi:hypothetical protein
MAEQLTAAVGRADITPPIGIDLVGFAGRGPSTGMHDPLTATALVLGCGETRAAVVACDLIDVDEEDVVQIMGLVEQRCGIPGSNVLLCCSHTHYGPNFVTASEDAKAYRAHMNFVIAGLVTEAESRLVPVRVGVGTGSCDVNINRRERQQDGTIKLGQNPDGVTDRDVIVVRIDEEDGRPLAAVVNYACHGVCLSSQWRLISSDFPGPMREVVEGATGATTLYLQGATGNMNPFLMGHDYANTRSTGVKLAGEVLKVWESVEPEEATGLCGAAETVDLPSLRFLSEEGAAAALERDRAELEQRKKGDAIPNVIRWIERRIEREEAALRSWKTGEPPPPIPDRVHALRFGPAAVASTAGEIFAQIGIDVKTRSPLPHTLFAGYTNGDIGYVPIPDAYAEGGYEVERACRVDPDAAAILTDGCLRMLDQVKA